MDKYTEEYDKTHWPPIITFILSWLIIQIVFLYFAIKFDLHVIFILLGIFVIIGLSVFLSMKVSYLVVEKIILSNPKKIREFIDRSILSGEYAEEEYLRILRKNEIFSFEMKKPVIDTSNLYT